MLKKTTILLLLCLLNINTALGQADKDEGLAAASIQDISTVVAIGAGGAILGLSTLSFVEEPGDHLKNVLIGGAIGIIIGVGVVAFKQANLSQEQYINSQGYNEPEFETKERLVWHSSQQDQISKNIGQKYSQLQYAFSF
jgi:hypothetical protein